MYLKDAIRFMLKRHGWREDLPCDVLLGCDGVKESNKVNSATIEVTYIALLLCYRHPLALRLGRGYKPSAVDSEEMVNRVVDEIVKTQGQVNVYAYISDKPARSKINKLAEVASIWTCEFCVEPGVRMEYPDENGLMRGKAAFPLRENVELKTHDMVKEVMTTGPPLSKDNRVLGYCGKSILLKLPGFDIVNDVVVETLHGLFLGLQKRLIGLIFLFDSDAVKPHLAPAHRINPTDFIGEARPLKAPSDFNRGVQRLEVAMKGEEFRNFSLCTAFLLGHKLQSVRHRLVQVQLLFSFVVRAYLLPQKEFEWCQETVNIRQVSHHFQELYHKFHSYTWVYYSHAFSHLDKVRAKGPLTMLAMFPPEVILIPVYIMSISRWIYVVPIQTHFHVHNMSISCRIYVVLLFQGMFTWFLDGIQVGTTSVSKQGIKRVAVRYSAATHKCFKFITFKPYVPGQKKNDSLAYTLDIEKKTHILWRVIKSDEKNKLCSAIRINTEAYKIPCKAQGSTLDFGPVGVYKNLGLTDEIRDWNFDAFHGKAMQVGDLLTLLPRHVLQESNWTSDCWTLEKTRKL